MQLSNYLKGNINFIDSVSSWEESIKKAAQPLLNEGLITSQYIQDMIDNIHKNGPYIVIVPGIAMPHAQNNGAVKKTGVSMLKLKNPVLYPEDKEVSILIVLAAEDSDGHLELISNLSSMLIDDDIMESFKKAETEKEIIELIQRAEEEE
ncbi:MULTISPECIES: PTS sugar transporter subunit IIA [Oceanobacillus]|uniref:Ascorbate-specific PTS system EIIA component n=1 Tax=Oceanobacillus indicireducens TaxID=1004261 RepID=A0A918D467_9BACI|nr:PTS sugar transporter subunit IIA [Oceanobacillus indicireducens]GGN64055.1 PTS mannitol transporter subunit IIA [Oceanobacillus indicireducens]